MMLGRCYCASAGAVPTMRCVRATRASAAGEHHRVVFTVAAPWHRLYRGVATASPMETGEPPLLDKLPGYPRSAGWCLRDCASETGLWSCERRASFLKENSGTPGDRFAPKPG